MPTAFADLPDDARVRLTTIAPALNREQIESLLTALDKLFTQFTREGRISAYGIDVLGDGQVLALGWCDQGGPLSGCSHDKIGQILAQHEQRTGAALLSAPPILISTTSGLRCVDRAGLKTLVMNGAVDERSEHWDLRLEHMQQWRTHGRRPAGETWVAPLITRARQAG